MLPIAPRPYIGGRQRITPRSALDTFPWEAEIGALDFAHDTVATMKDDTLDIVRPQIFAQAVESARHAFEDDTPVADEGIGVVSLVIGVEMRPT